MQGAPSIATASCRPSCSMSSPLLHPIRSRADVRCRAFSSTAAMQTWSSAKPFDRLHMHLSPGTACRQVTRMGNKSTSGIFVPVVQVVRQVMGKKEFNKLRGKGISLHSQVIKEFGKRVGADNKQVQGLVRLAKSNGEKLGFLA